MKVYFLLINCIGFLHSENKVCFYPEYSFPKTVVLDGMIQNSSEYFFPKRDDSFILPLLENSSQKNTIPIYFSTQQLLLSVFILHEGLQSRKAAHNIPPKGKDPELNRMSSWNAFLNFFFYSYAIVVAPMHLRMLSNTRVIFFFNSLLSCISTGLKIKIIKNYLLVTRWQINRFYDKSSPEFHSFYYSHSFYYFKNKKIQYVDYFNFTLKYAILGYILADTMSLIHQIHLNLRYRCFVTPEVSYSISFFRSFDILRNLPEKYIYLFPQLKPIARRMTIHILLDFFFVFAGFFHIICGIHNLEYPDEDVFCLAFIYGFAIWSLINVIIHSHRKNIRVVF